MQLAHLRGHPMNGTGSGFLFRFGVSPTEFDFLDSRRLPVIC
jgi:hypothetical protein